LGTFVAFIILSLGITTVGYPQKPLSIGDKVPTDIAVRNIIRHSTGEARVGDFRGKLLILDFWATWCSPCIAMMPKSDSLQKAFGNSLQILPVTDQSRADVERVLAKSARLKGLALPIAVADTTLGRLFPHTELPHYVWIDQTGTVVAITDHQEVNAASIRKVLDRVPVSMVEKRDAMKSYDREVPLLFQPVGIEKSDVVFQSLMSDYVEGLQSRFDVIRDVEGRITRITMANAWVQLMFGLAYSDDNRYFSRSRIVLEVRHPEGVISDAQGAEFTAWLRNNNAWCYELIVPSHLSSKAFEIMRADMVRLFPQYRAEVEIRKVNCLALVRTSAVDKIKTRGDKERNSADGFGLSITNSGMGLLTSQLNHYLQHLRLPVVDGTGYTGKIDLALDATLSDVSSLRQALAKYDLDLIERKQDLEVLVISDAP
jgi:thiol-disulfide isomerase/thioredoxin